MENFFRHSSRNEITEEERKKAEDERKAKQVAAQVGALALGTIAALGAKEMSDRFAQGPDAQPAAAVAEAPESAKTTAGLSSTDAPPPIQVGASPEMQTISVDVPESEKLTIPLMQPVSIPSPRR